MVCCNVKISFATRFQKEDPKLQNSTPQIVEYRYLLVPVCFFVLLKSVAFLHVWTHRNVQNLNDQNQCSRPIDIVVLFFDSHDALIVNLAILYVTHFRG